LTAFQNLSSVNPSPALILCSRDEQPVPFFDANRPYDYRFIGCLHFVEHGEAIVRSETQLPLGSKGRRLTQWFAVSGGLLGLEAQLCMDLLSNQAVILPFNRTKLKYDFRREDEREGRPPWH